MDFLQVGLFVKERKQTVYCQPQAGAFCHHFCVLVADVLANLVDLHSISLKIIRNLLHNIS